MSAICSTVGLANHTGVAPQVINPPDEDPIHVVDADLALRHGVPTPVRDSHRGGLEPALATAVSQSQPFVCQPDAGPANLENPHLLEILPGDQLGTESGVCNGQCVTKTTLTKRINNRPSGRCHCHVAGFRDMVVGQRGLKHPAPVIRIARP
jgi:hypothetical protein